MRIFLTSLLLLLVACIREDANLRMAAENASPRAAEPTFVAVEGTSFVRGGEPYAFVGANMWYAAYLGADAPFGDRERLSRELDLLLSLGVTNLRILGAAEESPYGKSLRITFRDETDEYDQALLEGLDYALAEMGKRGMTAVIYLGNFWEWSGGFGTYLAYTGKEPIDLGDPAHPWPAFPRYVSQFYADEDANALYRDYVRAVVTRTNSVTGIPYADDPVIMSWQLANEPRPNPDAADGSVEMAPFQTWIDETAGFIKSIDENHLVSTGNEGAMGCNGSVACARAAHDGENVDYVTFHMWPRNWSWFDPADADGTFEGTLAQAGDYIDVHVAMAEALGKPAVIEEFGLDRAGEVLMPGTDASHRDRLLAMVYGRIEASVAEGGPLVGSAVWAWGGYGRSEHEDGEWQPGDTSYTGDPPQEPQGRNSIFDADAETLAIIARHASALGAAD